MTRLIPPLLALLAIGCGRQETPAAPPPREPAPPTPVQAEPARTVKVIRKAVRETWQAIGTLRARQTTRVGPQVSGRVLEVLVDVGKTVKMGQELVRLDPTFFEIERAQRRADLEAAKVSQAEAELNFTRMKNLWERPQGEQPSIPRKLYDEAKSRVDAAVARVQQAEEGVRWAQERLRETTVRAPFDGVITQRFVDVGQSVTTMPVTELVEVQEVGVLELEFSLPQEMLGRVTPGTRITFEAEGVEGATPGAVEVVFPALDPATRSFRSRVLISNADGRLRPGLLTEVEVVLRESPAALVVPRGALAKSDGGWLVTVDGKSRPVKIGILADDEAEVVEGLREGDQVQVN